MKKEDFNAGTPYSCWLREEVCAEINAHIHNLPNRGLIKKYNVEVNDDSDYYIMNVVKNLDDYNDFRKVAVDIIRAELDGSFEK